MLEFNFLENQKLERKKSWNYLAFNLFIWWLLKYTNYLLLSSLNHCELTNDFFGELYSLYVANGFVDVFKYTNVYAAIHVISITKWSSDQMNLLRAMMTTALSNVKRFSAKQSCWTRTWHREKKTIERRTRLYNGNWHCSSAVTRITRTLALQWNAQLTSILSANFLNSWRGCEYVFHLYMSMR